MPVSVSSRVDGSSAREVGERRLAADEARARLRQVVACGAECAALAAAARCRAGAAPSTGSRARRWWRSRSAPSSLRRLLDLRGDVVLLDDEAGPDEVEQLLLGDQPLVPLGQREQQVEGARAERRRLAATRSTRSAGCNLEVVEAQRVGDGGWHGHLPANGRLLTAF